MKHTSQILLCATLHVSQATTSAYFLQLEVEEYASNSTSSLGSRAAEHSRPVGQYWAACLTDKQKISCLRTIFPVQFQHLPRFLILGCQSLFLSHFKKCEALDMNAVLRLLRRKRRGTVSDDIGENLDRIVNRVLRAMATLGYVGFVLYVVGFDKILENYKVYNILNFDIGGETEKFKDYFFAEWPRLILALALILWFSSYKDAVLHEIRILRMLFVPGQAPRRWATLHGSWWINISAVFFVITFGILALALRDVTYFSVIALLLNILDFNGNRLIQSNLRKFLSDRQLIPSAQIGPGIRAAVRQLRRAAKGYWLHKPQTERVLLCFAGNAAVLMLALKASQTNSDLWLKAAYLAASAVIFLNELTMFIWRIQREKIVVPARDKLDQEKEKAILRSAFSAGDL